MPYLKIKPKNVTLENVIKVISECEDVEQLILIKDNAVYMYENETPIRSKRKINQLEKATLLTIASLCQERINKLKNTQANKTAKDFLNNIKTARSPFHF